ncbi:MAG TPA: hypothetical protein VFM88_20575 [Vicinamibacteria bacterium]|nr:hypothetical protein [Vicinamibacteria bacterium]
MGPRLLRLLGTAGALGLAVAAPPLWAQAFTAPKGLGSVTLAWQYVDNTGHMMSDGYLLKRGESVTTSALLEAEYAVTDRLSASFGIPYVFAKYTGAVPPLSGLPHDTCRCWNSSLQDFGFSVRYRLGGEDWAVTPVLRYGLPSHDYTYQGEAVVGRNLQEVQLGALAGLKLGFLPKATVQAAYTYAFVEKPLDDTSIDRSQGFFDIGYSASRRLYVRAAAIWQRTHGGLRAGSVTGNPFPFPGELNTPERYSQRDRVLRSHYWQLGGGLSYSLGSVDVFASYSNYVWGRDSHDGQVFGAGVTWYFGLPE